MSCGIYPNRTSSPSALLFAPLVSHTAGRHGRCLLPGVGADKILQYLQEVAALPRSPPRPCPAVSDRSVLSYPASSSYPSASKAHVKTMPAKKISLSRHRFLLFILSAHNPAKSSHHGSSGTISGVPTWMRRDRPLPRQP